MLEYMYCTTNLMLKFYLYLDFFQPLVESQIKSRTDFFA